MNGMIPIYDGIFFQEGAPINQGNVFDFADEDFYGSSTNPLNQVHITSEDLKGYQKMKGYR